MFLSMVPLMILFLDLMSRRNIALEAEAMGPREHPEQCPDLLRPGG
jgi:hypothetical protein